MKHLLKAVALAMVLASGSSVASAKVSCPELNTHQKKILTSTWHYGEKHIGQGWGKHFSAIAYQESKLGKDIHGHGSYGLFQMQPRTALWINDDKITGKSIRATKSRLLNDTSYSITTAGKYVNYWKEKSKYGHPHNVFAHYNGGVKISRNANKYADSVMKHSHELNKCFG